LATKATEFGEIMHNNDHYAVQGHSRSPSNLPSILHRFQVTADYVKFSLATGGRYDLTPSLGVFPCEYRHNWYIVRN